MHNAAINPPLQDARGGQNFSARDAFFLLGLLPDLSPASLQKVLANCGGNPANVFNGPVEKLKAGTRLQETTIEKILGLPGKFDLAKEYAALEKHGITLLTLADKDYPAALKETEDPPCALFVKGDIAALSGKLFAVVGTRKPTPSAEDDCRTLCRGLCGAGLTIVSGLAYGIDRAAHETALECGGKTIAVLGSGLNHIYPREHTTLARTIIEGGGAVLSEFPPETEPETYYFPRRNRVISGLSLGVLVAAAGTKSGALITAQTARKQNRPVFAVPGGIGSADHKGNNALLKAGAQLADTAEDILAQFTLSGETSRPKYTVKPDECVEGLDKSLKEIYKNIHENPVHVDQLAVQGGFSSAQLLSALVQLELKGLVRSLPGKFYRRCR